MLDEVSELLKAKGFKVVNIDAVVVAEQPKMSPFIEDMRGNISRTLGIKPEQIMIKATTTDGLGFAGRGEGISAYAAALVEEETR